MNRFAAARSRHPVPTDAIGEVAGALIEALDGDAPDLLVAFCSPHYAGAVEDVASTLVALLAPGALVGATMAAATGGHPERVDEPALALWAAVLPDTTVRVLELRVEDGCAGPALVGWPPPEAAAGESTLVLLADPFTFPADPVLARLAETHPQVQVIGGLASAARGPGGNRLLLGRGATTRGAVGVLLHGGPPVAALVSQGCRPFGQPFTVTAVDGRYLVELGGRPALARLRELAAELPEADRALTTSALHLGVVVDEHRAEVAHGDFLVQDLLGAREEDGALALDAPVELGRTVQLQLRDAATAEEDLRAMLAVADRADAALLFTCTGRGGARFGAVDHDAGLVADALGPVPIAGALCAGALGPVAGRNHVHGSAASLALFRA